VWGDVIIYYFSWYPFQVELVVGNNRYRDVGIASGLPLAERYRDVRMHHLESCDWVIHYLDRGEAVRILQISLSNQVGAGFIL
jgi:hypothetical protein